MSQRILFAHRDQSLVRTVFRSVKRAPVDLLAVAVSVGVVDLVFALTTPSQRLLRAVVGLPFVLFLPGYVLVAVVFPGADRSNARRGIGLGERAALSFGMSLALLPPLVLVVELVSTGVPTAVVIATVSTFLGAGAILASVRRLRLPQERQFELPVGRWLDELRESTVGAGSPLDAAITVALLLSIVLATSTLGYALIVPTDGETYSSFSLLAEDEAGELAAADYPDELVAGEDQRFAVGIENEHSEPITYTVVVELQEVRTGGGTVDVLQEEELERFEVAIAPGEEQRVPHSITPSVTGEDLRLQYYLYEEGAPADASSDTADRRLFLWVSVSEPA